MDIVANKSFVRWQSATRKHFTVTSNLVLGLSTGLLAFVSDKFLVPPRPCYCVLIIGVVALLSLTGSIAMALICSINRLRDFRATAQIARKRAENGSGPSADRLETKALGRTSWRLFWWQLVLFGIGVATSVIALVSRAW